MHRDKRLVVCEAKCADAFRDLILFLGKPEQFVDRQGQFLVVIAYERDFELPRKQFAAIVEHGRQQHIKRHQIGASNQSLLFTRQCFPCGCVVIHTLDHPISFGDGLLDRARKVDQNILTSNISPCIALVCVDAIPTPQFFRMKMCQAVFLQAFAPFYFEARPKPAEAKHASEADHVFVFEFSTFVDYGLKQHHCHDSTLSGYLLRITPQDVPSGSDDSPNVTRCRLLEKA